MKINLEKFKEWFFTNSEIDKELVKTVDSPIKGRIAFMEQIRSTVKIVIERITFYLLVGQIIERLADWFFTKIIPM